MKVVPEATETEVAVELSAENWEVAQRARGAEREVDWVAAMEAAMAGASVLAMVAGLWEVPTAAWEVMAAREEPMAGGTQRTSCKRSSRNETPRGTRLGNSTRIARGTRMNCRTHSLRSARPCIELMRAAGRTIEHTQPWLWRASTRRGGTGSTTSSSPSAGRSP